jgi:3-dehydroquinate synthetase
MIDEKTVDDGSQEISPQDARQAQRAPGLIWVLVGGVVLAVVGFALSTLFRGG